jgi:hypothetical protein
MEQESGSRFKLVYPYWTSDEAGFSFPIPNGLHIEIVKWIQTIHDTGMASRHLRIDIFDELFQKNNSGFYFRHSNFIWHFLRSFSYSDLVKEEEIINDDNNYIFPIELELQGPNFIVNNQTFILNNNTYNYSFIDTIPPAIIELIKKGKVKILLTNLIDQSISSEFIHSIGNVFSSKGIDLSNIILAQGNICKNYVGKIKQVSGIISLFQAAELMDKFPFYSGEVGYQSDIVREIDLDANKFRSKRFLCWNRSMNRPHRLAMAYIALKYNLLEHSIFSFVTSKSKNIKTELEVYYRYENDFHEKIKQIDKLIPYEVDTHHLSPEEKKGFQTVSINNKDYYLNSYIHITSETAFDNNINPFFSEKTWRPIMNLQPFIYVGNPHALKKLRSLGFKTFSPFIDESYDLIENHVDRLRAIEHEIDKINRLHIDELHNWYCSIKDILIHNQQHIRNFKNYNPYDEVFKNGI